MHCPDLNINLVFQVLNGLIALISMIFAHFVNRNLKASKEVINDKLAQNAKEIDGVAAKAVTMNSNGEMVVGTDRACNRTAPIEKPKIS